MSLTPAREADLAAEVRGVLRDMDSAFATGDANAFGGQFVEDGRLLLLYREPIIGRPAIVAFWREFFGRYDTSAWQTDHGPVEVHGQHAYVFSTYSETLVPRQGGPSQLVVGRLVLFLHHLAREGWRIALLMNSHARPIEHVI